MRASAALGLLLATVATASPGQGRPLLRSFTTPWLKWAMGKAMSSFQPSVIRGVAQENLPRCPRRQFLNTTLPIFLRECRSLLADEGSAYGCSLSCARAFAVVSAAENAKCVGMVLDDRDKLRRAADRSAAVDIPPPPYFASLYTEAFTRCEAEESFKARMVPIFMQECRSLPEKQPAGQPRCPEGCVHGYAALKAHPCFGRWFEDLVLFRHKFPSDAVAEGREATLQRAGAQCGARVATAAEVRNLCSEQDYVLFEELRLPAMLHACLEPRSGGDFPDPQSEEEATVRACPLTCAHTLWQVLQDSHCLQRYQRNAAGQDRGAGRLVGQTLATALDVCGMDGRSPGAEARAEGPAGAYSPAKSTTPAGYVALAVVLCAALIALVAARIRSSREAVVVQHA